MSLILNKDNPLATKVEAIEQRTGNRLPARLICVDMLSGSPLLALILFGGSEHLCTFPLDGINGCGYSLVNVVEKQKWCINVLSRQNCGP